MAQIIVDLPWVNQLNTDVSDTTSRMRAASSDAVSLSSSPDVDGGTTDFMNRWDERRGNLADCLQGISDLLQAIYDSFQMNDEQLYEAINGDGGG